MTVFNEYAGFYDVLYQDKDYVKEATYIHQLLNQHGVSPNGHLLELGSGTARHAIELAKLGYSLDGIDLSANMLEQAGHYLSKAKTHVAQKIRLSHGDVRSFRANRTFDAVISLFHVLSYQISNQSVDQMFETAATHLQSGGLFIFDCWYGPSVLSDLPKVRSKKMRSDQYEVERVSIPTLYPNENQVQVQYDIFHRSCDMAHYHKTTEQHHMRYFFLPELKRILMQHGFELLQHCQWLTQEPLDLNSFGACFIVKKQ